MQKKVGNALYVFDTTPFTITEDTDAEVIYVQQECLKGYLELNTELESKIKTFNQWVLCVNAPWADGDSPEPSDTYTITVICDRAFANFNVAGYVNDGYGWLPYEWDGETYTATFEYKAGLDFEVDERVCSITGMNPECQIDHEPAHSEGVGTSYIMPNSDVTITVIGKYHIGFTEDSNASGDISIAPSDNVDAGEFPYIRFQNDQSSSTIAVTSEDVQLSYDDANDEYYFEMPAHDVNIKAVYTQPIEVSIDLGDTDLTCSYDPEATYYPHAFFVAGVPEGKSTDDYTFVKSNEAITVAPLGDHFDIEFKVSGSVTFANA